MAKRVLLIESDTAHAREVYRALEARGVEVRVTGDGAEGLELAREERPDAVVLCVELPRISGWSVCQKLKKDGELKDVPVLLTSAEATLETFEQHRKLKGRAEAYLLKPFPMQALVDKLAPVLGLDPAAVPPPPPAPELLSLDEVELEPTGQPLEGANPLAGGDDDLTFLDAAFDRLAAGAEPSGEPPAEVELGIDFAPEADASAAPEAPAAEAAALSTPLDGLPVDPPVELPVEPEGLTLPDWPSAPPSPPGEPLDAARPATREPLDGAAPSPGEPLDGFGPSAAGLELEPFDSPMGVPVSAAAAPERATAFPPTTWPEPATPTAAAPPPAPGELEAEVARLSRALEESEADRRALEARLAQAEERVLRAVARLRQDALARERVRKALAVAGQLLGGEPAQAPAPDERTLSPSPSGSTPR